MRPPRIQVLAGVAAGWTGLAGCSIPGRDDGGAPTGTPTGTVHDLSYAAEVREQPSADAPARIRAELSTRGETTVRVGTNETIPLGFEHGPERVVLFPETPVGPNDAPTEPTDGCWRYTDDDFLVRSILEFHDVDPGDPFVETYRVYTWGEERSCLPDGQYEFAETVLDGNESELELRVDVAIDGGRVSVEASERLV